jgi:hypothetical protein
MSASTRRAVSIGSRRAVAGLAVAVFTLIGAGVSGCAIINNVSHVVQAVQANRAMIKNFANLLKSGKATPFQATYVTTGSSPTTVIYAVQPPKEAAFKELSGANAANGTATVDLISNATGEFSCTTSSGTGSSGWQCTKLGKANAHAQNQIVSFYTASHWISFLTTLSIAAGLAGDKVSQSSMTVNGISLHCVDFNAKGSGLSTICSTPAGILGYVKVAGNPTSFEIKSFTTSPPASDFQLPPGATVTGGTVTGG